MKSGLVACDVDGVLKNFLGALFFKAEQMGLRHHFPETYKEITSWKFGGDAFGEIWRAIESDGSFWAGIAKHPELAMKPEELVTDFYLTACPVHSSFRGSGLLFDGFPDKPIVCVPPGSNKVEAMKHYGIRYLLDDKFETFQAINEDDSDTTCYLLLSSHNMEQAKKHGPSPLFVRSVADFQEEMTGVNPLHKYQAA